jgi:hypothetical protein
VPLDVHFFASLKDVLCDGDTTAFSECQSTFFEGVLLEMYFIAVKVCG